MELPTFAVEKGNSVQPKYGFYKLKGEKPVLLGCPAPSGLYI